MFVLRLTILFDFANFFGEILWIYNGVSSRCLLYYKLFSIRCLTLNFCIVNVVYFNRGSRNKISMRCNKLYFIF